MFQFPGFASNPYEFRVRYLHGTIRSATSPGVMPNAVTIRIVEGGFPHSEILGSKLVRSSPRLIAAYHVLHRLSAPRHPPNALKTLDRSHDRCPPLGSDRLDTERPFAPELFSSRACLPNTSDTGLLKPCWSLGDVSLPTLGYVPSSRFQTSAGRCNSGDELPLTRTCDVWWSQTGSNRRPPACKAGALPTELWPRYEIGSSMISGGPGTTRTSDLTLIRGAL